MKPKVYKSVVCHRHQQRVLFTRHPHHHHPHPLETLGKKGNSDCDEEEEEECEVASHEKDMMPRGSSAGLCKRKSPDIPAASASSLSLEEFDAALESCVETREQLVYRLRIYNSLLNFHKAIKEDQVYLYRRLQEMDELYLRNTAVILRLGFCPCLVHQQTRDVGDQLMTVHRQLRLWDKKLEGICDVVKEPSTRKTAANILRTLKICDLSKVNQAKTAINDVALPDIVWDLGNHFLENLDIPTLREEWVTIRNKIRESLCSIEIQFREICLEFGVRRGPAQTQGGKKLVAHVRKISTIEMLGNSGDDVGGTVPVPPKQEEEESSVDNNPNSKISSTFL